MNQPKMKRGKDSAVSALVARWDPRRPVNLKDAPFGYTADGYKDYRGFPLRDYATVIGRRFLKHDLSHADFSGIRIEGLEFSDCRFRAANFRGTVDLKNRFYGCVFSACSFAEGGLGLWTSHYEDCVFENNDFSDVNFKNAVFRRTRFDANRFANVFMDATGFWDCTFSGQIYDVTFRGNYLFEEDTELFGAPTDTGLHNVDFSRARLAMVACSENCAVDNLTMPVDGSSCVVEAREAINTLYEIQKEKPDFEKKIDIYIKVFFRLDKQERTIVSMCDFEEIIGADSGGEIYSIVKKHCEVTD